MIGRVTTCVDQADINEVRKGARAPVRQQNDEKRSEQELHDDDDYIPFDPSTVLDDSHLIFSGDDEDAELGCEAQGGSV